MWESIMTNVTFVVWWGILLLVTMNVNEWIDNKKKNKK